MRQLMGHELYMHHLAKASCWKDCQSRSYNVMLIAFVTSVRYEDIIQVLNPKMPVIAPWCARIILPEYHEDNYTDERRINCTHEIL